jgi:putative transcriptional regulator
MSSGTHPINLTNQFLIAMPGMTDGNFAGAVVYLCEHTERGALGLVINKPSDIKLKNLFERVDISLERDDLADQPVFIGGPVQTERGFVLHEPDGSAPEGAAEPVAEGEEGGGSAYTSSLRVPGGLEMTTSKDVLEAMAQGLGPKRVVVMLGYAGWGAGQLEDELGRNGWLNVEAAPELIFDTPIEERYGRALGLLGITPATLSQEAGHA